MGESDLMVTADKHDLLKKLQGRLEELEARIKRGQPAEDRDRRVYARHVADVLQKAADEIRSGKLGPGESGQWCGVRSTIEDRVRSKEEPDGQKALRERAGQYATAIQQITMHRRPYVRVSTTQMQRWFDKDGRR